MGVSTLFIFLASFSASFSNLLIRKSIDFGCSLKGYLSFYFFVSFFASFFLNHFSIPFEGWSPSFTLLGALTGFLVVSLMFLIGKALKKGPSGLTYAFLNSGSILPPLVLALNPKKK